MKTLIVNFYKKKSKVVIFSLFFLISINTNAAIYYARTNGEWNSISTWSLISRTGSAGTTIPGISDTVIIDSRSVALFISNAGCKRLELRTSVFTATSFTISNSKSLVVADDVSMGNYTNSINRAQRLIINQTNTSMSVGGNLIVSIASGVSATYTPSIELANNATLTVAGTFSYSLVESPVFQTVDNINLDDSSVFTCGSTTISMPKGKDWLPFTIDLADSAKWNINGNLEVSSACIPGVEGGGIDFDLASKSQINITGNLTITFNNVDHVSNTTPRFDLSGQSVFSVGGDFTCLNNSNSCVGQINIGAIASDSCLFTVDGNFSWTNIANAAGPYSIFEQIYLKGKSLFDVNGNFSFTVTDPTQSCRGFLTTEDFSTINFGSGSSNIHSFDIYQRDSYSNPGENNIKINANTSLNIQGDFTYRIRNKLFDAYEIFVLGELAVTGDLILQNTSNAFNLKLRVETTSGLPAVLDVDGNIDLTNAVTSGRIELELINSAKIEIGGNFLRNPSPDKFGVLDCQNTSTVEYNGTSSQFFAADAGSGTDNFFYKNVIINNTSAISPQLTMEGLATINTSIVFVDGIVATTPVDLLVIVDNATTSGASNDSHVDGFVQKAGNDAFIFPVGNDGFYAPCEISAPATTTTYNCRYNYINPDLDGYTRTSVLAPINHVSSMEYWDLNQVSGTGDVTIKLSWDTPRSGGVSSLPELLIAHWTGAQWVSEGNGGTTGNTLTGTIITSGIVANYSPFTLSSATGNNPLPVLLSSFEVIKNGTSADIMWTTQSEINSDYFIVERSKNGTDFEEIVWRDAAGSSNTELNYLTNDPSPYIGLNYYRLKQVDFNNTINYSEIKVVNFRAIGNGFTVYPNPASEYIFLDIDAAEPDEIYTIEMFDALGKKINHFESTGKQIYFNVQSLSPGTYYFNFYNKDTYKTERFIKQ